MNPSDSPPASERPLRGTALALGVIGAALALLGTGVAVLGNQGLSSPTVGVLTRVGAILLAVSAVLPSIRKPSTATVILIGAGLALVLIRPGLIWVGLVVWLVWALASRQRNTE